MKLTNDRDMIVDVRRPGRGSKAARVFRRKALLIVDVQNDFCAGGSVAIAGAERVIPAINKYIRLFQRQSAMILASRDWHPRQTRHFRRYGGRWSAHCLARTRGAAFHPELRMPPSGIILSKGTRPETDGYSAFDGRDEAGNSLLHLLSHRDIKTLYIAGLGLEWGVFYSCLDALGEDFSVYLLLDAIKGMGRHTGVLDEMRKNGAKKMTLRRFPMHLLWERVKI